MKSIIINALLLTAVASAANAPRLIKTSHKMEWMHENSIQSLIAQDVHFMDITDGELTPRLTIPSFKYPSKLTNNKSNSSLESSIRKAIKGIDKVRMQSRLSDLTKKFRSRYYKSRSGEDAAEWIYQICKEIAKSSKLKINVQRVIHPDWRQFSVRVRIDNRVNPTATSTVERVILSAHLDSIVPLAPRFLPAPGADDDGSGVVTQLEALNQIAGLDDLKLKKPIEFIFYSAEEAGLLGSQAIVKYYQDMELSAAVLHIDMDGYIKPGSVPGIGLLTDNTNEQQNAIIKELVQRYTPYKVKETQCGYACSDHYSWHIAGYGASSLFEGFFEEMNPHLHSHSDTIEYISFDHMAQFSTVSIAFALHLSQ